MSEEINRKEITEDTEVSGVTLEIVEEVSGVTSEAVEEVKGATAADRKARRRARRNSLIAKTAKGYLTAALAMMIIISIAIGISYWNVKVDEFTDTTFDYCKMASDIIDPEKVKNYISTGETDEYYYEIQDYLNNIRRNSNMDYYYIFIVNGADLVYVWDMYDDEPAQLGDKEPLSEDSLEIFEVMQKNGGKTPQLSINYDPTYGLLGSAVYPIKDANDKIVAYVDVDMTMQSIVDSIIKFVLTIVGIVLIVNAIASFVMYRRTKHQIVDPIEHMCDTAENMLAHIESSEDLKMDIHTDDEIEKLSHAFETMNEEVRQYIKVLTSITAEKERIQSELSVAARIQASMIPIDFPTSEYFEIFGSMTPAKEVGGDFYDFFMVDERHIAIVMADVSGKGVPAALFMVIAKTLIKYHSMSETDLGQIFTDVSNQLCETNSEGFFVTAFEGILDLATGEFRYVNAGHEPPFIKRGADGFVETRLKPGLALAAMEDLPYKSGSIMLEPGDRIFQYTDGATEATNADNQLFGLERLDKSLNRHVKDDVETLVHGVDADIAEFVGDAPQFDDLTMLGLDYKKKMPVE